MTDKKKAKPKAKAKSGKKPPLKPKAYEVRYLAIEKIRAYDRNAKKHPKEQVEAIAKSITEFGFNQPIVVDIANVVIVGHGRLEAAHSLGLDTVPVVTVDLSPEQARAYRIADNKLNESDWDFDLLVTELQTIHAEDYPIDLTGFSTTEFNNLVEQFGEVDLNEALGGLASGEKGDLEQITFTLTGEQAQNVRRAMDIAMGMGSFEGYDNSNKNGNAIARVCDNFITDHGESKTD